MLKDWLIRRSFWILMILGIVMEIAFYALAHITDIRYQLPDLYYYFTHAFVIYVLVILYVKFFWGKSFLSVELIVAFGILFRLTMVFEQPVLSDDIYRYIWDGRVANIGINPYRYVPESDNLAGLRDRAVYKPMNHKEVHTIYPPLMQGIFQATTFFSQSVWAMKLMFLLFDIGIMIVIVSLLKHFDRALSWVLVYAWNPLAVLETGWSGHGEVVAVFFMILGLWFAVKYKPVAAAIMLALSFLAKYLAIIFLPFVEDIRSRFKVLVAAVLVFAIIIVIGFLPFSSAQDYWFIGLQQYTSTWEFNSFFYSNLYDFLKDFFINDPSHYLFGIETDNKARLLTKLIFSVVLAAIFTGLYISYIKKSYTVQKQQIIKMAYILVGSLLLFSPTLHPWYLIWIIPLLCFYPNPAWIGFTGLITLSYTVLAEFQKTGVWQEFKTILLWQYIPFFVVLIALFTWNLYHNVIKAHPGERE
ncbi:glycosyltransferase 87 family protein [bacterium]|nr:glycosyltransferase 87 family protein [bacterium]